MSKIGFRMNLVRFATEESCVDYLISIRWPEGFKCPVCNQRDLCRIKRGDCLSVENVVGKHSGERGRGFENKALVVIAVEDKSEVSTTGGVRS